MAVSPDFERVDAYGSMDEALENREWDLVLCDHSMPMFSSSAALDFLFAVGPTPGATPTTSPG